MNIFRMFIPVLMALSGICTSLALAQKARRPFTVADEIGLTLFSGPNGEPAEVLFSPDGSYFSVKAERGRVDLDCVEDSIYVYRSQDVRESLEHFDNAKPLPVWVIARSAKKAGAIGEYRWLADSRGFAFLDLAQNGNRYLVLADVGTKTIEALTSSREMVTAFDVRDKQHYLYTVADLTGQDKRRRERNAATVVGTGRSFFELILPDNPISVQIASSPIHLWAVENNKRFPVMKDGAALSGFGSYALSPDGKSVVTSLPLPEVPPAWESLYPPPPYTLSRNRIHAGQYDANSSGVHQYVEINLDTGTVHRLTDAPLAADAGWITIGGPNWSDDGHQVVLPNTFLKSDKNTPSRPCVAVVDVSSNASSCVESFKAYKTETTIEEGYHFIWGARFVHGSKNVQVAFLSHNDESFRTVEYQNVNDRWRPVGEHHGLFIRKDKGLMIDVKEWFNESPVLVAESHEQPERVILDPNPQLSDIELGEVTAYQWNDDKGRKWQAGLYKPSDYRADKRYPLVIQTHGFSESEFRPSGLFPTGMAARALAAKGIVVLQAAASLSGISCPTDTPEEGPCNVSVYESAVRQLVSDGVVDPDRVGIIGFSRTCFDVMELLTSNPFPIKAGLITDGVTFDYFQYVLFLDRISAEADQVIGARPFGEGLQLWLKHSPGFNLDKANTPLMVVGEGPISLLSMWEPYAVLHSLKKPVDLIMLNTDEHVLTNPSVRMASQVGSVDWFRFWLRDEEDPDPAKAEQYVRWRELKELQSHSQEVIPPIKSSLLP